MPYGECIPPGLRCSACDSSCRLVEPTGPHPASLLLIGEKPGKNEDKVGRVFVGDTGKELDQTYLPLAGLTRDEVRVVNCVRCRLGGSNNKPTPTQVRACAGHWLPHEVAMAQPVVIVLLGATACSLVPSIELDKQHGMPVMVMPEDHGGLLGDYCGWVWASYHPAMGLHEGSKMTALLDDFRRLRAWMSGLWIPPAGDIPSDYQLVRTWGEIDEMMDTSYPFIPVDTELDGEEPWSLQYSLRPGHGRLIRAEDHDLLERFSKRLGQRGLLLHHAVHDIGDLSRMDVCVRRPFRDTMQEAYHLGNLPQGLKALSYRLMGVKMKSWEDTVMPTSRAKMLTWLGEQWLVESENPMVVEIQLKTKLKYLRKPNLQERNLRRILGHAAKPTYNIWAKSKEAGLAGFPIPSIAHAPLEEAIDYACRDADMTGRIGAWLAVERARIVGEEWGILDEDVDT